MRKDTTPELTTCKDCGEQFEQWVKSKARPGDARRVRCNSCFNAYSRSRPSYQAARQAAADRRESVGRCRVCQTEHSRNSRWCEDCWVEHRREESRKRDANPTEARKAHNRKARNWTRPCADCGETFTDKTARSRCARCWMARPGAPAFGPTLDALEHLGPVLGPPPPTGHCECGLGLFHTSRKRCPECSRLHNIDRIMALYNLATKTLKVKEAMFWRRQAITYLRERDGDKCALCSGRMRFTGATGPRGKYENGATIDHVIPRSLGGSDDWANLQLACWSCNRAKGNRGEQEQLRLVG